MRLLSVIAIVLAPIPLPLESQPPPAIRLASVQLPVSVNLSMMMQLPVSVNLSVLMRLPVSLPVPPVAAAVPRTQPLSSTAPSPSHCSLRGLRLADYSKFRFAVTTETPIMPSHSSPSVLSLASRGFEISSIHSVCEICSLSSSVSQASPSSAVVTSCTLFYSRTIMRCTKSTFALTAPRQWRCGRKMD